MPPSALGDPMNEPHPNPFQIHGVVQGDFFTDRQEEVSRIRRALTEPGSKLLVYGPRRMGKTSAILRAMEEIRGEGSPAVLADLTTASTPVDMSNRILADAARAIGARWRDFITDLVNRVRIGVSLTPDPVSGLIVPSLDVGLRERSEDEQRGTLGTVLDALNEMARTRGTTLGIALDEFQEIRKFGGETAEWDLRGVIQRHGAVGYVLAGSREHVIQRMIESEGALYKMVDKLAFGPVDPGHLARWIDERMADRGLPAPGMGERIVRMGGARTRDVVQIARRCFDLAHTHPLEDCPERAFQGIVEEEFDLLRARWDGLTAQQQNVLRAVAAARRGLTSRETLRRFALGPSGTASNAAAALVKAGLLVREDPYTRSRVETPTGYAFDSPFFQAWVLQSTLADIGLPE